MMGSALILFVVAVTSVAAADVVVLRSGDNYSGTVTELRPDILKVTMPDKTSRVLPLAHISRVEVVSEARREELLDLFSAAWRFSGVIPSVPIEVIGAGEAGPKTPDRMTTNSDIYALAGDDLRSAGTMAFAGLGLSIVGGMFAALASSASPSVSGSGEAVLMVTGAGLNLAGFICSIVAWDRISRAGTRLRRLADLQEH